MQASGRALVAGRGSLYNPVYDINSLPASDFVDIIYGSTVANNGDIANPARPGYDLASGVGTVNAAAFVPELASLAGR